MKKILGTLIALILILSFIITTTSFAVDIKDKISSMEITNIESGTYKTGQTVEIEIATNGVDSFPQSPYPQLVLQFGSSPERTVDLNSNVETNSLNYSYTIQDEDIGVLKLKTLVWGDDVNTDLTAVTVPLDKTIIANTEDDNNTSQDGLTDVSNVTFSWSIENSSRYPYLYINNINYDEDKDYYAFMSNEKESFDLSQYTTGSAWNDAGWQSLRADYSHFTEKNEVVEKNAPIYVWIAETYYNDEESKIESNMLIEAREIERPEQQPIGSRLKGYFFEEYSSTFCYEPYSDERNMVINYKIGEVTDINILRSIQNGESDCLEKLMEYAKSATNGKTGSLSLGDSDPIVQDLNLKNDGYYYVYMEVDDGDGTYYPIEDVSLYQACSTDTVLYLCDYLSDEFKWNLPEEGGTITPDGNEDNTVATGMLPQTGVGITLLVSIIAISGFAIYLLRKNKKFKDIK